jgi:hypothetical protein
LRLRSARQQSRSLHAVCPRALAAHGRRRRGERRPVNMGLFVQAITPQSRVRIRNNVANRDIVFPEREALASPTRYFPEDADQLLMRFNSR